VCVCVCILQTHTHTCVRVYIHIHTHLRDPHSYRHYLIFYLFIFFHFLYPVTAATLTFYTHTHTRACVHTYTHTCVTRIPCCDSATAATMKANPMITISPLPDFLFIYFFLIFFTAKPMINIPPLCDIFVFLRTREMVVLTSRATQDYFKNKTLQLFLTTPSRREIVVPTRRAIKAATK